MIRKPRKWWLPLTYEPKVKGVQDGTIRQTIRPKWKFIVGDQVAFHGWTGKPRRSEWIYLTKSYYTLTDVRNIWIFPEGLGFPALRYDLVEVFSWNSPLCDVLARLDGIVPATGEELGNVLKSKNKIPESGIEGQISRW